MWRDIIDNQKGLDADCFNSSSLISNLQKNEIVLGFCSLIVLVTHSIYE